MTAATAPAGGWYPDPNDAAQFRWWDGYQWTEHVHRPEPEPVPEPANYGFATPVSPAAASHPTPINATPAVPIPNGTTTPANHVDLPSSTAVPSASDTQDARVDRIMADARMSPPANNAGLVKKAGAGVAVVGILCLKFLKVALIALHISHVATGTGRYSSTSTYPTSTGYGTQGSQAQPVSAPTPATPPTQ